VLELVDRVVLVSEEDIIQATRLVMERCKLAAEPAGAAGIAALLSGAAEIDRDSRVVCVISGGNVDVDRLAESL
jgi:threonine dehydratase